MLSFAWIFSIGKYIERNTKIPLNPTFKACKIPYTLKCPQRSDNNLYTYYEGDH